MGLLVAVSVERELGWDCEWDVQKKEEERL